MTDVKSDGGSKTQLEEMNLQKWGREPRQEGGPKAGVEWVQREKA